jgi:hypothetical protein
MPQQKTQNILLLTCEPYWHDTTVQYIPAFLKNTHVSMKPSVSDLVKQLELNNKPDLLLLTTNIANDCADILDNSKDYKLETSYMLWQALATNPEYQQLLPPTIIYHTIPQVALLKEFTVNSADSIQQAIKTKQLAFFDMLKDNPEKFIVKIKQALKR